jgi:sterol desaturase/sphingolipid hydroxylase (fatty acid hydroxylase superfamily)
MGATQLILFAALLAPAALLEFLWPRCDSAAKTRRWVMNFALAVLWILLLSALWPSVHPIVHSGVAALAPTLPRFHLSPPLLILGSLLLLDFLQYWTHRVLHFTPWLWILHRVHHSDPAVDASTGVRHHPLEPLLNAPLQYSFIIVLGVPLEGAAAYALCATVMSVFAHANLRLPNGVDRVARHLIVTPDMHRVHHSVRAEESNSNFGMVFPYWDRLFRTYCAAPLNGHERLQVGVVQ